MSGSLWLKQAAFTETCFEKSLCLKHKDDRKSSLISVTSVAQLTSCLGVLVAKNKKICAYDLIYPVILSYFLLNKINKITLLSCLRR